MIEWIVTSSLLIVIVLLLRRALRGRISMGLQYALWGLVLLRLLIPGTVADSGFSVLNALPREPAAILTGSTTDMDFAGDEKGTVGGVAQPVQPPENQNTPAIEHSQTGPTIPQSPERTWTAGEILRAVWLAGVGAMGLWLFVGNLRFTLRLRRGRVPLPGMRNVYTAAFLTSPCLYGLFPPAIYLTPQAAGDEAVCRYVLRHEEMHRRHGDHLWAVLRGIALALHWYNPLVWAAAILSRRDGELACDEAVLRGADDRQRAEYGRVLIRLVAEKPRPGDLLCCATTMGTSALKERIAMIARKPRTLWAALLAAVLVLALAAGCTFTGADPGEDQDAGWTLDKSQTTDDYLISLVIGEEIALTGDNSFTFETPMDLSSQELYILALAWGGSEGAFDHCYDAETGEYTIRQEDLEAVLAPHFKEFSLDLTEISAYDSTAGAVVTWTVTGFGGDRYMGISEKKMEGNVVTFTAQFYEDYDMTGQPYAAKTYTLEFFDGGYWFLSAVMVQGSDPGPEARSLTAVLADWSGGEANEELIRAVWDYQQQYGRREWWALPDFQPDGTVDWDQLTFFVFLMCDEDEIGKNAEEYLTMTAEVFDGVVRWYLPELTYTHHSSSYFTYADGLYTATGWDYGGAVYYRPVSAEALGDGTYALVLEGFNFYEMDFNSGENSYSPTMEAIMNYAGGWPEDLDAALLEIFLREDCDEILPVFERLELTVRLSGDVESPLMYLSCAREWMS